MEADGAEHLAALRVDGGMAANDWFCQFLADILGIVVERPANLETTALGAAMLAGHASGVWADVLKDGAGVSNITCFEPKMQSGIRAKLLNEWHIAIRRAMLD